MKRLALATFALVALAASAGAQVIPPGTNPVPAGGAYNSSPPTCVNGSGCWFQTDVNGNLKITTVSGTTAITGSTSNAASAIATSSTNVPTVSYGYRFNGTTWDQARNINGALAAGTGTAAVALAPTSSAAGAITPVVSTTTEGSHVLKAGAGNFYSLVTTTGAASGYVMVFNATSAPVDGAVTPIECVAVAANSTVSIVYSIIPSAFSTGITAVFSTTGCFTKTISATAFFSGKVS